jgi:hypothetical protein
MKIFETKNCESHYELSIAVTQLPVTDDECVMKRLPER